MLYIYGIKDNLEKLTGRGIFCAPNDGTAKRMIAVTISREMNPIGLKDKCLVCLGTFDENTGLIAPNKDNVIRDVTPLSVIFDDVKSELSVYEKK